MSNRPLDAPESSAVKEAEVKQITQVTGSYIALTAFVGGMSISVIILHGSIAHPAKECLLSLTDAAMRHCTCLLRTVLMVTCNT